MFVIDIIRSAKLAIFLSCPSYLLSPSVQATLALEPTTDNLIWCRFVGSEPNHKNKKKKKKKKKQKVRKNILFSVLMQVWE